MVSGVNWTTTYDLHVDQRHFKVFITEQSEGAFDATCLWYDKGRMLKAPGQFDSLSFHLEHRFASSEADALGQLEQWAKATFGEPFTLKKKED